MGAATLLTYALKPARKLGSGMAAAPCAILPKPVPYTLRIIPGANTWSPEAALRTPATERRTCGPRNGTNICVVQGVPLASTPLKPKTTVFGAAMALNVRLAEIELL